MIPLVSLGLLGWYLVYDQGMDTDSKLDSIVDVVDVRLEDTNDEIAEIHDSLEDVNEAIDMIDMMDGLRK